MARSADIARAILLLRGQRVILDAELAALYAVTTKRLNEQIRRNRKRFPDDFIFQLSADEAAALRSQIGDGSRFSVDWMAIAGDFRPLPDHRSRPEQYGSGV